MKPQPTVESDFSIPVGTVTFLLADVEGSVRRWESDQDAMTRDTKELGALLADTIGAHSGVRPIEQGEGDSAVAAFAQASDAVACALEIQRRLGNELPGIRLRIGIHTGEAQRRDAGQYFGRSINRCARLRDLGHGGQTLVSRATYDLVIDRLPDSSDLKDLGTHRLRDLARPEQVFQLTHPDLPDDFPPLRGLDARPHNLPVQLTSFIGRATEIADIDRLLESSRIVTLAGSGGCGKTRLALQVAAHVMDRFPDGVWWVDLAPVADPDLVPSTVAAAIEIRETPTQVLSETVKQHLRERRALIVLDNCEHIAAACAFFAEEVLRSCPSVSILATSRAMLDVDGETLYRVPSLSLPHENEPIRLDVLSQSESVALFIDRALRVRPNFQVTNENAPAVADICHRLEGIPLAIELAAARARMLSLEQIADGLTDVFRLLAGGARAAMPRQQTLLASVEWSYRLLSEEERILFRRLAAFAGGFTLDAAENVCSGDGIDVYQVLEVLSGLVDKSLVQVDETQAEVIRYRLLETIRQYAVQKLTESGEEEQVRDRHLDFYTALAERAEPHLIGSQELAWMELLSAEVDNLRAALDWSVASGRTDEGLRMSGSLAIFWFMRNQTREACDRYDALLAPGGGDPTARAAALYGRGLNSVQTFDWAATSASGEKLRALGEELDDRTLFARGIYLMGIAAVWMGDWARAEPLLQDSLEVARGADQHLASRVLWALGSGEMVDRGDVSRAVGHLEEGLAIATATGSRWRAGWTAVQLAWPLIFRGDFERATELLEEAYESLEQIGERAFRSYALSNSGSIATLRGDYETAHQRIDESLDIAMSLQHPAWMGFGRINRTVLFWAQGCLEEASAEAERAEDIVGVIPFLPIWVLLYHVAIEIDRNSDRAEALLADARDQLSDLDNVLLKGRLRDMEARLARAKGDPDLAESLEHEGVAQLVQSGSKIYIVDALEQLAGLVALQESHREAVRLFAAAQSAREKIDYVRFAYHQSRYDDDLDLARAALTDEEFAGAWNDGAAMSLEEAVAYAQRGRGERKRPSTGWASLTPTELEVATLVAQRLTNPQIGERLFISRGTVKTHLSHIYDKLGIRSRAEVADEVAKRQTA